jgi:hypothetical protein
MHGLTENEIRDVVLDLRNVSLRFRVSFRVGVERIVTDWDDWVVDWEAGTVRGNRHPDGPDFPLEVWWGAVMDAVARLRSRQRRERLALPAPAPSLPPPRRPVGRPGVADICTELFKARRSREIPLESQIAEAAAIVSAWPKGGPPKPLPETVSGHISDDYRQAKEAADQATKTDKL